MLRAAPGAEPLRGDAHEHVIMDRALPLFSGEPGRRPMASSPGQQFVNQLDANSLRAARVRVVFATLWPPPALRPGVGRLGAMLHQLDALNDFAAQNPQFAVALDAASARAIAASGRIALVPAFEGAEGIEKVDDVDALYAAGARVIQLVHFTDNALADAEDGQLGPAAPLFNGSDFGLTPLGRDVVRRMEQLGIVVDLSHASERAIADVLKVTRAPLLYSHAGSAFERPRTLDDAQARALGARGGVIGIGVYRSPFLKPIDDADRFAGFVPGTCDEVVAHWLHYTRVAGAENVVLGSDFNSPILRADPGGACPHGLRNAGDLPELFEALVSHGVPSAAIDRSGDRLLQLLESVQTLADPSARAKARSTPVPRTGPFDTAM